MWSIRSAAIWVSRRSRPLPEKSQLAFRLTVLYAHQTLLDERLIMAHRDILRLVGDALGQRWAYFWRGAHHFKLDAEGDWTVSVRPDSAGRVRIETCHLARVRATKWSLEGDSGRIVEAALEARDELLAEA